MVTNDERREMAARLRGLAAEDLEDGEFYDCGEETAVLACVNEDGDMEWVKPRFCGFCGAKVVEK